MGNQILCKHSASASIISGGLGAGLETIGGKYGEW